LVPVDEITKGSPPLLAGTASLPACFELTIRSPTSPFAEKIGLSPPALGAKAVAIAQ
jgi:hypothetical protein